VFGSLERSLKPAVRRRRFGDLRIGVVSQRRLLEAIEASDPVAARAGAREIMAQNREFVVGLYALGVPAGDEALV
jgi:DNA-binding FadR family transcriptional regulator